MYKKTVKVLFITRLFYPHIGGVEKHIEKVSGQLQKMNYDISVLTTKHTDNLLENEEYKNIKICRINPPKIKFVGLLYIWYWMIFHLKWINSFDVIHIHDIFIWYWPLKVLLPFKKVFVTIHGQWSKIPKKIDVIQKKIAVIFSNASVCVGRYLEKYYAIKADHIIYGATDYRRKTGKKDAKVILYVGRLDKDLTLRLLLQVAKKLKGFKVLFCGDGDMRKECEKYGKVLGFTDPHKYLSKANYCFASGYLTIIEALSCECNVIVSYANSIQKDYYEMTPFKKYIHIFSNSDKILEYFQKNVKIDKLATKWAHKQNWMKIAEVYQTMWTI